MKIVIVN